jgi:hypothetical protein
MKKILDFISVFIFGKVRKGEKAYPNELKFRSTYPNNPLSEESWKILHKVHFNDD